MEFVFLAKLSGFVEQSAEYLFGSAKDYTGMCGLISLYKIE
jgi:hypothetical protein